MGNVLGGGVYGVGGEEPNEEAVVAKLKRSSSSLSTLSRNKTLTKRQSIWHAAAQRGHCGVLRTLAEATGQQSGSLVSAATTLEDLASNPVLNLLVNEVDRKGRTPLMLACAAGHTEATETLLRLGADRWAADKKHGDTALHYASRFGHEACVRLLIESSDRHQQAASIARRSSPTSLVRSSRRGAYKDVQNDEGFSALHYAVGSDQLHVVQVCLYSVKKNIPDMPSYSMQAVDSAIK